MVWELKVTVKPQNSLIRTLAPLQRKKVNQQESKKTTLGCHTIDINTMSKAIEIGNVLTVRQSGCPYSHQGYHWPLQSTLCAILDVPFPKGISMQALLPCFSALLEKVYIMI
jgi:hypothetical protein